jgi:hypothetical protein
MMNNIIPSDIRTLPQRQLMLMQRKYRVLYKPLVTPSVREIVFIELLFKLVPLLLTKTMPGFQTFKKVKLTSFTLFASLEFLKPFSVGIVHLLTPHHHLRNRAPTLAPLNFDALLKCRQPKRIRFQSTPCAKHIITCLDK